MSRNEESSGLSGHDDQPTAVKTEGAPTPASNAEANGLESTTTHRALVADPRASQGDEAVPNAPAINTGATQAANHASISEISNPESQECPPNALVGDEVETPTIPTTLRPIVNSAPYAAITTDEMARAVREQIIQDSVVADVTAIEPKQHPRRRFRNWQFTSALVCVLVLAALAVGLSIHFTQRSKDDSPDHIDPPLGGSSAPTRAPSNATMIPSTLVSMRKNGVLKCGVYNEVEGMALLNETSGRHEGFSADLCRAFSALVFDGDTERVEFVPTTATDRYELMQSGLVDLVSQTVTHNMQRDFVEPTSGAGYHFSPPFYYSGLGFGGLPEYVNCAEKLDSFVGECRNLRICVGVGSTQEDVLRKMLPGPAIVALATPQEMFGGFATGLCNCLAADPINMPTIRMRQLGYDGPYKLGTKLFSHDPLCLISADVDPELTTLVDLVIHILITAETENVTMVSAESWGIGKSESGTLDSTLIRRIVDVVGAAGNLGELYDKHMEAIVPRSGVNLVNSDSSEDSTGLLYSYPYGDLTKKNTISLSGTITSILQSGKIQCAIVDAGDALLRFHDEFCKALSAALFRNVNNTTIVYVSDDNSAFEVLESGSVDVVIGAQFTLESLSQTKNSFSRPTYYDELGGALALVTSSSDQAWSDLVYWLVIALINAEDMGISQSNSIEMPTIPFFGEELKHLFRDCVAAVGNYGDLFNRTLPEGQRTGRNRLSLHGPQHFPVPWQ